MLFPIKFFKACNLHIILSIFPYPSSLRKFLNFEYSFSFNFQFLFVSSPWYSLCQYFQLAMLYEFGWQETLAHSSNYLAARISKMAKTSHQMQVTDFVKACVSFNEVTIPSVRSILRRLNLFLETAEVSRLQIWNYFFVSWANLFRMVIVIPFFS